MIDEKLDYRWQKIKNGKPFLAIMNLEISKNDNQNEIIEEYDGKGWVGMGNFVSIPAKDEPGKAHFRNWRKAVIKGLEFVFSKTDTKWTVKIKKVEGLIATDTNPTIVGYAAILAFCRQTNLELDFDTSRKIEDFTFKSWEVKNSDIKIPNFTDLKYEDDDFNE
ncbi:hypothetical protein [Flavobacterium sp. UGB4466]|uniref:hypothetical protein n=1 Tax=Flavobacterium sp. UGB4466 TaxID=2730889 RepID=UPI00192C9780|nr:hypothetical protein [Flavobacterium sp. UGB4466]